jgi:hypothetical protein
MGVLGSAGNRTVWKAARLLGGHIFAWESDYLRVLRLRAPLPLSHLNLGRRGTRLQSEADPGTAAQHRSSLAACHFLPWEFQLRFSKG